MGLASIIKQRALQVGFDLAGIAGLSALDDLKFLPLWLDKGYGGEMDYLADPKREDPRKVLPSVKSVICVGLIYNTHYPYSTEISDPLDREQDSHSRGAAGAEASPRAWISRYAWGQDYHAIIRSKLEQLRTAVEELAPNAETRVYVDTGPIMERTFARLSGMGWMGKNTCLINEQHGSWFFLGVILTNLELELDVAAPDRCGACTRCLEACPTGALVAPYVMDASRCIAYFNIELRGSIPEEFRPAIGNNVFGCDICQDVCPWNNRPLHLGTASQDEPDYNGHFGWGPASRRTSTTDLPHFRPMEIAVNSPQEFREPDNGNGLPGVDSAKPFSLFSPEIAALASLTEEDFKRVLARSPIKRAKYRGWLRNLCVVMGNSGDCRFEPWLEAAADYPDAIVREHAAWALQRLRSKE